MLPFPFSFCETIEYYDDNSFKVKTHKGNIFEHIVEPVENSHLNIHKYYHIRGEDKILVKFKLSTGFNSTESPMGDVLYLDFMMTET